jgi:hypothetical protein
MAPASVQLPIRLACKAASPLHHFTSSHAVHSHDHRFTHREVSPLTRSYALHCCTTIPDQLLAANPRLSLLDDTDTNKAKAFTMTTHTDTGAMDVDSDTAASIQSDSSQVSFVDEYETLPSNGPRNHAHVIDLGEYTEAIKDYGMLQLQDAVATTLYKISPETLRSFLSPTVNTIKLVFGKKDVQLVIWRKGLEVFVSSCTNRDEGLLTDVSRSARSRIIPA